MALHLDRQREIAEILARNGFSMLVAAAGLTPRNWLAAHWKSDARAALGSGQAHPDEAIRSPQIVRRTIEQLGPTFIKLGQILSTRADLLPPGFRSELSKLQDAVPPMPSLTARRLIETELGAPVSELFAAFDDVPLGAASLAQVHAVTLHNGTRAVVKVQRENLTEIIEADLEIIGGIVDRLSDRFLHLRALGLSQLLSEFDEQLHEEIDFVKEGHNAERIAANFAERGSLHAPRIFWKLSTRRVLTEELLEGIKISDVEALDQAGIRRERLAVRAATIVLDMVLQDGYFHSDPHPGNMFVEPDGTIALMDYGMCGSLTDAERDRLIDLVIAFVMNDAESLSTAVLHLAPPRGHIDELALTHDLKHLLDNYAALPLSEISIRAVVTDVLDMVRRFRLRLTRGIATVLKMLAEIEGTGRQLDPDFLMVAILKPYTADLILDRFQPSRLAEDGAQTLFDALRLGRGLPRQLQRILDRYERQGVTASIDPAVLEPYVRRAERLGNRVIAGVVLSALITAVGNLGATDNQWLAKARGPLLVAGTTAIAGLLGFVGTGAAPRDRG